MVELVEKLVHQDDAYAEQTVVYNLVNPEVTSWSKILPVVQELTGNPRTLPLRDWVSELQNSAFENHGFVTEGNPAVQLLDFFRDLSSPMKVPSDLKLQYEVSKLVRDNKHASRLEPVSPEWIKSG
jgi:hypothetical protein